MSQFDDDDSKPWTEHDLKEAVRRINAGEINFKEAEDYYGISPRTIHRQRAIENMRAQLNPEKAKKAKPNPSSSTKKDVTVLRKSVDISCTTVNDVVTLLETGTEEVKQLLNYECDLIYECKVCKNLFRSLVNFVSHKRVYCCDMYSVLHTRTDDGENGSVSNEPQTGDKIKSKDNVKEFTAKPFRITCRKDLTSVLKRITSLTEFAPAEPILKIEHLESSPNAFQQTLVNSQPSDRNDSSKPVSESPMENTETSPEAEFKTESTAVVPPAAPAESSGYVAEKRFRCPVCAVNFTIKKSVMRHLKAVHNQSPEQMERLKPRIQMHYVRRKTGPAESNTSTDKKSSPTANKGKPEKEPNKSNWEKTCVTCNRLFINRNAFAAHSRSCNRLAAHKESEVDSSARTSTSSRRALQPVVSLTPLSSPPERADKSGDSLGAASSAPPESNKRATVAAPASAKMDANLAALSSTSTCKKIGIQVRMNYGKANAHAPPSSAANGVAAASSFPSAPLSAATSSSSSSAANSRRSSFAAPRADDQTIRGSAPRSGASGAILAHILETLLEKKSAAEDRKTAPTPVDRTSAAPKCNDKRHLPQPNARHAADGEVAQFEYRGECQAAAKKRQADDKTEASAAALPRRASLPLSNSTALASQTSAAAKPNQQPPVKAQPPKAPPPKAQLQKLAPQRPQNVKSLKRKLGPGLVHSKLAAKRKPLNVTQSAASHEAPLKTEPDAAQSAGAEAAAVKRENCADEETAAAAPAVVKKSKKAAPAPVPVAPKTPDNKSRLFPRIKIKQTPEKPLVNGIGAAATSSSSDEENDLPLAVTQTAAASKAKANLRRQYEAALAAAELKSTKTPPSSAKVNCNNDLSSSSSTPDSDVDPSTLTEENLKKSIMTIIFGKDIPTEKMEEGEKSPTSSCTSSDSGKEKRYSVRIAKQSTSTKNLVPIVDCRDDKVTKIAISSKVKATR